MAKEKLHNEILAPAGSVEQLMAAVNNGCDSVYLGLESFNARMKAPNFTTENIGEWIDYCHLFGVKVYVAINTSLKNAEFTKAVELLKTVYLLNADGVIVTDLALIRIASNLPKPFDVVASTQLNAHDRFGARFLSDCGATTVVCARESSIQDVADIVSTGVNVECFIHGATCVCQSGQCLFSSIVGGNSGNRGLCAQPCRKRYSADNGHSWAYLLSARDLCGLSVAKKIRDSGASVYKIEGRNRRAEYAGITSRIYKRIFDNDFNYSAKDKNDLAEMYNRSMSELSYLHGDNKDIIAANTQNHIGVRVGEIKGRGFVAEVEVSKGDGLKVFGGGEEICGGVTRDSGVGFVNADFDGAVRDGMEVRRTTSVKLCEDVLTAKKLLPVTITFTAYPNEHVELNATCSDVEVCFKSDFVAQKAVKTCTTESEIIEQFNKTGNSHYTITDIAIKLGEIFLPKSQINALRRQLFDVLDKAIIQQYNATFSNRKSDTAFDVFGEVLDITHEKKIVCFASKERAMCENTLAVICRTKEQLRQAKEGCRYLIYKPEFINDQTINEANEYSAFVDLPSFSDNDYIYNLLLRKNVGIVCHNVGHVEVARALNLPYIAGSGLNIYNDFIASEFDDAQTFVYSLELTLNEIDRFHNQSGLTFVDGYLNLMQLVHCPYKLNYRCNCSNCQASKQLTYLDEMGNTFNIVRRKDRRCTFELQNGKKLSVVSKLKNGGRFLVDYNARIVEHYSALNNGIDDGYTEETPYTKGRLFNKVN